MGARKLTAYWPQLLLGLLVLIIAVINYSPDTWLSGWDNLHPEFNFSLNTKRSLSAVWQEYQGVGLLGGMGHASDLPRQIFLWVCSIFIPTNLLRYFYTYLCLFLGPLGLYYLVKTLLVKEKRFAFLAALFYLFNLATVQNFYFPFAPFVTHFAFLPWLLLLFFQYLKTGNQKTLFHFFLVSLFSLPQAYVPTLFIVYVLSLACLALFYLFKNRGRFRVAAQKVVPLFLIVLAVNAFWLFPQIHFTLKNSAVVTQAKMNQMASRENFLKSQKFGDLQNVALMKNFWFDNTDVNPSGQAQYVMPQWRRHLDQFPIRLVGYSFFSLVLLGLITSLFKKDYFLSSLATLFLIALAMIASKTFPFSSIVSLFRNHFPLFSQIFRSPFTKFSTLLSFSCAIFFGLSVKSLVNFFPKLESVKLTFSLALVGLLIIFIFPIFRGYLFYPRLRAQIPAEYFQLFDWFQNQDPNARIANFPQYQFWGWNWYRFGHTGSGFLWYGLPQPILDRAFDTWSNKNEGYFWEISQAIYSENIPLLEDLIEKYQINYLLLDKNIIAPGNQKILNLAALERMFSQSKKISLVKEFNQIKVYEAKPSSGFKSFVGLVPLLPSVSPGYQWTSLDTAFSDLGLYFASSDWDFHYPFRSLSTQNNAPGNLKIESDPAISLTTLLPTLGKGKLTLPNWASLEPIIPVQLQTDSQKQVFKLNLLTPKVSLGGQEINLNLENLEVPLPNNLQPDELLFTLNQEKPSQSGFIFTDRPNEVHFFQKTPKLTSLAEPNQFSDQVSRCAPKKENEEINLKKEGESLTLQGKEAAPCVSLNLPLDFISPEDLVKITFDYQSSQDEKPAYCLYSEERKNCLNQKEKKVFGFSQDQKTFEDYTVAVISPQDKLSLRLLLDAYDQKSLKTITYQNITLEVYSLISLEKVFLDPRKMTSYQQEVELSEPTELKISLPSWEGSFSPPEAVQNHHFSFQPEKCSRFVTDNFGKEIQTNENQKTIIAYQSTNSNSCQHFLYSYLPHNLAYLLTFKTKNISGLPLRTYFTSQENQHAEIITFLKKTKDWQSQNLILPPKEKGGQGYSLTLENISFGGQETKNQLAGLAIHPLPFSWLKAILLEAKNSTPDPQLPESNPPLLALPFKAKKKAIFWYQVEVPQESQNRLLILSQAFDAGWVAFLGKKRLKHVLVNNWENGWIVENSNLKDQTIKLNIFYLPQILEFLGLILFLIAGGFFCFKTRKMRPKYQSRSKNQT